MKRKISETEIEENDSNVANKRPKLEKKNWITLFINKLSNLVRSTFKKV